MGNKSKIKHDASCNDFNGGGQKSEDIIKKIAALKCPWIHRRYDENIHEWVLIPVKYIQKTFGNNFKFHSN